MIFYICSVRTSQIRNLQSAKVSFPGQLKRIVTGQTATSELEKDIALVHEDQETVNTVNTNTNSNLYPTTENCELRKEMSNQSCSMICKEFNTDRVSLLKLF